MLENIIVYSIEDNEDEAEILYINLTNKCTNNCIFCIKKVTEKIKGKSLLLINEDITLAEVKKQLKKFKIPTEVVFCGYGEPFIKIELLKEISKYLKANYKVKIRVNTNGHGNFINKRNILPELVGLVDEISVSLNSSNSEQYNKITQTTLKSGFNEVKDFIKKSVENNIKTTATVVDEHPEYKLDLKECEAIAVKLGATFKIRKWLNNGY